MCLSNKHVVYQLCCEKVRSVQDHSVFPMPLHSSSDKQRSQRPNCYFPTDMESRLPVLGSLHVQELCPAGVAGLVPSPGKEQGKGTWATNTILSSKAFLVPAGSRRKDSNSLSLSAVRLPVCETVCTCARVCLSWKRTATPVRIFHSDLCSLWFLKAFLTWKQNQVDRKYLDGNILQTSAAFPAPFLLPVGFRQ